MGMTEMEAVVGDGVAVDVFVNGYEIKTDQRPKDGGTGAYPDPFEYFLSSLAACAAYYIAKFCSSRDIPSKGIRLKQRVNRGEGGKVESIEMNAELPPEFPEKYMKAVLRAADTCTVKKVIQNAPEFKVNATIKGSE